MLASPADYWRGAAARSLSSWRSPILHLAVSKKLTEDRRKKLIERNRKLYGQAQYAYQNAEYP
jgi:hypothetical protein